MIYLCFSLYDPEGSELIRQLSVPSLACNLLLPRFTDNDWIELDEDAKKVCRPHCPVDSLEGPWIIERLRSE
jgi:hypothetical protein